MPYQLAWIVNHVGFYSWRAVSKTVYKELRNRVIPPPTAQLNFNTLYVNDVLEWKEIYSLPFRTYVGTIKLRKFQYKLLNRCLITNSFLSKIGIIPSPARSFCGEVSESLELFLVIILGVLKWLDNQGVKIDYLSDKDKKILKNLSAEGWIVRYSRGEKNWTKIMIRRYFFLFSVKGEKSKVVHEYIRRIWIKMIAYSWKRAILGFLEFHLGLLMRTKFAPLNQ